jgi:hypothetical protein
MNIQDLKNKNLILFEAISGSRAFGLATGKFRYGYPWSLLFAERRFLWAELYSADFQ